METIFSTTTEQITNLTYQSAAIAILTSLILGLIISFVYLYSDRDSKGSVNFAFTLVILPALVCIVIILVGSNVARAFSMAGAFALVRFRSVPGDSKDIASVFFAMSVGLATGLGYIIFAVMFTAIIGVVYFVLRRIGYGTAGANQKVLKVTLPENLNYQGLLDDLFQEFTVSNKVDRVRTTNMGSLFEITYLIKMKKDADEKKFIDEIRCRNGNLNIVLCNNDSQKGVL